MMRLDFVLLAVLAAGVVWLVWTCDFALLAAGFAALWLAAELDGHRRRA